MTPRLHAVLVAFALLGAGVQARAQGSTEPPDVRRSPFVSESGGVVLTSEWPGGLTWKAQSSAVHGTIFEHGSQTPAACAFAILETSGDTVRADSQGHFSMAPVLPGRYQVAVADARMQKSAAREVEVLMGADAAIRLELPRSRDGGARTCVDNGRVK